MIGICNSWSELVHCNIHFRGLAAAVKRGVVRAGGVPIEFPTLSLSENLMKPTTMLYRNLMAMDVEECIRAHPFDAVVLIGGCDKTVPAQLMGAASADIPAICLHGGPGEPASFGGRELGVGTDLWRYTAEFRAGRIDRQEYEALESSLIPSPGHCSEMGTASTMAAVTEALGMSLPGSAFIPAVDARRVHAAESTGSRAVALAIEDLCPSDILSPAAFDNAVTVLVAIGGSTNAILHLIALARRVKIELTLDGIDEIARPTPRLADVRPAGHHLVEALFHAGGVPALVNQLGDLIDGEALTVTGCSLIESASPPQVDNGSIRTREQPAGAAGGLRALKGSLAPSGAIIKAAAASESLMRHRGPALVFESLADVAGRIDDPELPASPDTVLVLRNAGPCGGPGMPEWGMLPIPKKLLETGVRDMVRVSDGRMSGTGFGTVVLHITPESAVGGPLALVCDGDFVVLDVPAGSIDLDVPSEELERRRADLVRPAPAFERGYGALYLEHVLQADQGCDFDLLLGRSARDKRDPVGLDSGWVGGW